MQVVPGSTMASKRAAVVVDASTSKAKVLNDLVSKGADLLKKCDISVGVVLKLCQITLIAVFFSRFDPFPTGIDLSKKWISRSTSTL